MLLEGLESHFIEIPKLLQQWREENINPWENTSQSSSFHLAYEEREKVISAEQAKLVHARERYLK
nr:hypothetical protein GGBNIMDK_00078 [Bacillus cereus]